MTINSDWIKKDFKQKYFLFCREKEIKSVSLIEKYSEILAQLKEKPYICRIIIKEVEKC